MKKILFSIFLILFSVGVYSQISEKYVKTDSLTSQNGTDALSIGVKVNIFDDLNVDGNTNLSGEVKFGGTGYMVGSLGSNRIDFKSTTSTNYSMTFLGDGYVMFGRTANHNHIWYTSSTIVAGFRPANKTQNTGFGGNELNASLIVAGINKLNATSIGVGINETSPTEAFHVNGTGLFTKNVIIGDSLWLLPSDGGTGLFLRADPSTDYLMLGGVGANSVIVGDGSISNGPRLDLSSTYGAASVAYLRFRGNQNSGFGGYFSQPALVVSSLGKLKATATGVLIASNTGGTSVVPTHDLEVDGDVEISGNTYLGDTTIHQGQVIYEDTFWDDLQLQITGIGAGASGPTLEQFVYSYHKAWAFAGTVANQEVYLEGEFGHDIKDSSDIEVHLHLSPSTIPVVGDTAVFNIYILWASVGDNFASGDAADEYFQVKIPICDYSQWDHIIFDVGTVAAIGNQESSIVLARVFRQMSHTSDVYEENIFVFTLDMHYEKDKPGSDNQIP